MKFYTRLAYYLSGFAIGMIFLFFILNGKETSCSYFPNARVLKHLREVPFKYSDLALQKLSEKWVDTADVRKTLTYGDVDFEKSNIKLKAGKLYTIYGKNSKGEAITLEVINYDDAAELRDIKKQ
ncbi:MAG: hypothetical protein CFE23_13105 [Flavobacterium sp. BFFFF1]|uniref:DUF4258 domain-containing protein n=1 Tax=unclassified Flavobacterium TaxID=196869 RepID=UPI000BC4379F|nr:MULTISPECIES: DUF4258 domain-containing protein [unclassified Flavobacterium]OYU79624.1 MAG: hypothetical protein CFE23_13105 [Flavobacterium sp. BFFFF1]